MSKRNHSDAIPYEPSKKAPIEETINQREQLQNYIKDPSMLDVLHRKKIKKLFPIQYMTYRAIFEGKDLVGRDRTGSGKTLAFSLPLIIKMRELSLFKNSDRSVKILIILPTRELALQVRDEIQSLKLSYEDFSIGAVYGGSGMQEQMTMLKRGLDIVVGTPGRLMDFFEKGLINCSHTQTICLDEADQMLNMGFKDDIERIFSYVKKMNSKKIQTLLFSATIPDWIWDISRKYQDKDHIFIDQVKDSKIQTSTTVKHYQISASRYDRQNLIDPIIKHFLHDNKKKVIIFCETKRDVERIKGTRKISLKTEALHGDVKQFMREKVYKNFKYYDLQCIIATNVAARGLDFPQIDLIIQMQPPKTTDSYIHRSGRTGRAGKQGVCVTFYNSDNSHWLSKITKESKITIQDLNTKDLDTRSRFGSITQESRGERRFGSIRQESRGDRRSESRFERKETNYEGSFKKEQEKRQSSKFDDGFDY